ncbi:MAG: hypothetical protein RIM23_21655 [Coleofasciculus sp. G3-WIS-01]
MANSDQRKQRIMEHIKRSITIPQRGFSMTSDAKKQQIMDHIKMTRG